MTHRDNEKSGLGNTIGATLIMLVPLIFFCIGAVMTYNTYNLYTHGTQTVATVTGHKVKSDSDGTTYCTRVKFRTRAGQIINYTNDICSSRKSLKAGESVPVYYFEDDPFEALIYEGWTTWIFPLIFTGVGGFLLLLFAGGTLTKSQKRTNKIENGIYDIIKRSKELKRKHDDEFHRDPYDEQPQNDDDDKKSKYGRRRGL